MNKTDWHNGGINQVYMDGHAKWNRLDQIRYGQWARSDFMPKTDRRCNCPITIPVGNSNHPCQ